MPEDTNLNSPHKNIIVAWRCQYVKMQVPDTDLWARVSLKRQHIFFATRQLNTNCLKVHIRRPKNPFPTFRLHIWLIAPKVFDLVRTNGKRAQKRPWSPIFGHLKMPKVPLFRKFCHHMKPHSLFANCGVTSMGYNFGHQVELLGLIANLATCIIYN